MSKTEELLANGNELIKDFVLTSKYPEPNRLDVWIEATNLKAAVSNIIENHWGYLITITGMDQSPKIDDAGNHISEGKIEGLYPFANQDAILTLRTTVDYENPKFDSICEIIPSATIYEREFIELFGVEIVSTPDTSHLVLPDVWPENTYPLRKSFTGLNADQIVWKGE